MRGLPGILRTGSGATSRSRVWSSRSMTCGTITAIQPGIARGAGSRFTRQWILDQKALLRRIANSRVYQLDSEPASGNPADDTFYTFYFPKRLMAEQPLQAIDDATARRTRSPACRRACVSFNFRILSSHLTFSTAGRSRRLVALRMLAQRRNEYYPSAAPDEWRLSEKKLASPSGRIAELASKGPSLKLFSTFIMQR